ncbi:MAG TPA: porin [Ferruginibacter sp.]|nr:porin [Ferruginibacter sp.]
MIKVKKILLGILFMTGTNVFAQDSVKLATAASPVTFSGYVEAYYQYDFNKPADNNRPGFIYSHNRHNEFNLNLGFIKGSYSADRVRANIAMATGTYMNANYAAETGVLKNIYEANAGIKISKKKNLWIDAGIFSSHIGFESAISKDCWTLTRSMLADNSPYFESGAKITYTTNNNKWIVSGLLLNGWQRIKRVDDNSLMSYGTQVQFKPNATTTLNYSSFIGTDKPDSSRQWRYFHNLYGIFNVTSKFGIIAGFDIGSEQKAKGSSSMNTWYSPVLILKYAVNDAWALAARGEYYYDKNGVIIASGTPNGFQTAGFSLNIDYMPASNAVLRLEARTLNSKDDVFVKANGISNNNTFITTSIAVSF